MKGLLYKYVSVPLYRSFPSSHHASWSLPLSQTIMPRSGYSRRDPIAIRSGYVSHDNNPVDRRGGPESHSGRINHARMNDLASPDPSIRSFNPQSRGLDNPDHRLFSSTASDLSEIPSRDDLYRSEPSQELERRSRGYNPGYFGERVSSHGSSPQLGGLDHGYRGKIALFLSRTYLSDYMVRTKMRGRIGLAILQ